MSFGVKAIGQIRPIYDDSYVGEMSLREDTYPRPCVFRWPAPYLVAFISQVLAPGPHSLCDGQRTCTQTSLEGVSMDLPQSKRRL